MRTNSLEKSLTLVKGLRFGNKSINIYCNNKNEYLVLKKYSCLYTNIINNISRHKSLEEAQNELDNFKNKELGY